MSSTSTSSKPEPVVKSRSEVQVVSQSLPSKSMSPGRTHRVCSSGTAGKTEEARRNLKWRPGGGGGGLAVSLRGGPETRIPRAGKGKENLRGGRVRGGGARIVKPVTLRNGKLVKQDLRPSSLPGVLTDSSPELNAPVPTEIKPGLGNFLKSKAVPDIHRKLLQKIRGNKRKSLERKVCLENQTPLRAPAPSPSQDRESPVSGSDLQMYLTGVFNMADKYKSGTVSTGRLLECITSMVDLPKLDKWKLEELKRMLDPMNDNRYVDAASWCVVGQSWVEMMMNPDFHAAASPSDKRSDQVEIVITGDEYQNQQEDEVFEDNTEGAEGVGSLSFEGVGGNSYQLSSNREFELQNKVSELEFLLARVREEKKELENNLVVTEETGLSRTSELEEELRSHKRLSLSTNVLRDETLKENGQLVQDLEQKCNNLQLQLDILEDDMKIKDERLGDNEVLMVSLRSEAAEAKEKEAAALALVENIREKVEKTEILMKKKEEEINREIVARELVEERFEESRVKVDRLQQNLSMKEEEIKNLTETTGGASRLGSVGSSTGANQSFSTIHDISVDEKAIEAQQCLLTPGKLSLPLPTGSLVKVRGPSASSTPNKPGLGSIAEELMNLHQFSEQECLQSPFCEKKESQVSAALDRMLDNIRAAIRAQTETKSRKELLVAVGREVSSVKQVLEDFLKDLPSVEDHNSLREKRNQLETELNEANLYIEHLKLKSENNNDEVDEEEEEGDLALEEVANMSMKVGAVADLLKTANSLILAQTEDTDFSLEPDTTDVSGWQLDLDGIQLVEWQQRLLNYSKKRSSSQGLRSAFPTELSRSPVPGSHTNSLLWHSLHNRLEDLQKASETSRDLLILAGDSLRDQSLHQSVREVSTVQVQTEVEQEKTVTTTSNTTNTSNTSTANSCLTDNCFCQKSQAKPAKGASRMRTFVRSLFSTVFLLLIFTFFCGLQIDQDIYYPVTWYSLRMWLGDSLPDPMIAVNYQTGCQG